ncbi:MAG: cell wall-binding repeat-containing protein, partial [Acidimicrobiales bacterium]
MRKTPLWLRRLVVGGVSAVTVGGVGFASLIGTAGAASATSTVTGTRLAGPNRFATAAAIAAETFPKGAATVIVANGLSDHLPDSLAASYLAAQENGGAGAPILLVNTDSVPSETSAELTALGAKNVVIVGGTAAVSTGVQTTLAKSYTVTRVSGADRFATADAVDSQSGMTNVKTVNGKKYAIVADGVNGHLVDSLGSSPISYAENFPVLLVNGPTGVLSSADLAILKADGINDVLIIGGTAAVGTQVDTQLTTAGYTPLRPAEGVNRSQTSELLADYAIANFGFVNTHFNVASGSQAHLVDSLSGGPHSGSETAPTLITDTVDNPGFVSDFATKNSATESSFHKFGGTDAISDANEAAIIKA